MIQDTFATTAMVIAMIYLIWNCFEVGRNDAANLVNAVFGARVLKRRIAVLISGFFVVLGATNSSSVMDTMRKGIFSAEVLSPEAAIALFLSANLVCTVLLYAFSAFGIPVSTTATLVFALAGSSIGVALSLDIVNWTSFFTIIAAIVMSIFLSAIAGFMGQRIFRGAIRDKGTNHTILLLHGPWVTGLILTCLSWFMLVKGLKSIQIVRSFRENIVDVYGTAPILLVYWAVLTLLTHLVLAVLPRHKTKYLFHFTAVVGMCCMAFAFGQNDLANAASPGLSSLFIWLEGMTTSFSIPRLALFACGVLIFLGMTTKKAQRVTRAEVNMGSQYDSVSLYSPAWSQKLAKFFIRKNHDQSLAPAPSRTNRDKKLHYDPLRASVIMAASASVIAFASGVGLPVSTTYVAFAAVLATGWGDKVFVRGDADKKVGRAIWVIFCWFFSGFIALTAGALMGAMIFHWQWVGLAIALALNLSAKVFFGKKSDQHEALHHGKKSGKDDLEDDEEPATIKVTQRSPSST
ncbi:MAG: inorganic phosphate transporter [Oligoflexus sp.]